MSKSLEHFTREHRSKLQELIKELHFKKRELDIENYCNINDCYDFLRIGIKYIIFDLEATRRENTYLKSRLSEK